jgi:hypothetical protein
VTASLRADGWRSSGAGRASPREICPGPPVSSAVVKRLMPLALVLLLAACDGGAVTTTSWGSTTSSAPIVTTPTTDPGEDCRRLAEDAYEYLASVVEELQGVTVEQLEDREQWPEALVDFEAQGEELDRRADEFGCDPGAVQQEVLVRASALQSTGLGRLLLDLLLGRLG